MAQLPFHDQSQSHLLPGEMKATVGVEQDEKGRRSKQSYLNHPSLHFTCKISCLNDWVDWITPQELVKKEEN